MTGCFPLGVICLHLLADGLDQPSCKGSYDFFWLVAEGII